MAEEGILDRVFTTIRRMSGKCSADTNLEDLKASVQLAQGRIDKVLLGGKIVQGDSAVFDKLTKANEGLEKVGESLENVQNVCLDIVAIGKIHDAIKVLQDDRVIYDDPQKAAEAFDSLFQGFGRLCRFLPPPAKEWGEFFEQFNLFGNFQKKIMSPYMRRFDEIQRGERT
jgi:hypothetical protein